MTIIFGIVVRVTEVHRHDLDKLGLLGGVELGKLASRQRQRAAHLVQLLLLLLGCGQGYDKEGTGGSRLATYER